MYGVTAEQLVSHNVLEGPSQLGQRFAFNINFFFACYANHKVIIYILTKKSSTVKVDKSKTLPRLWALFN